MAWWYLRSGITESSAQASNKGRKEVEDKGDSQYWLDSDDFLNVAERIEELKKKKQAMTKKVLLNRNTNLKKVMWQTLKGIHVQYFKVFNVFNFKSEKNTVLFTFS